MIQDKIIVACIQIRAGENVAENLARCFKMITQAKRKGAQLACLPEVFHYRGRHEWFPRVAQTLSSPLVRSFQNFAKRIRIGILLGSVIEKAGVPRKFYNTSILISEKGRILGSYRKIHLFDIALRGKVKVSESKHFLRGNKMTMVNFKGIKAGLTICYDLRFPELYRRLALKGAELIFVPSNFTDLTGRAHWEVLLQARAIENQVYIIAPAQVGSNPASRIKSFGRSLIVDPWGKILARGSHHGEEIVMANIDRKYLQDIRKRFPVLKPIRLTP